LPFIELLSSPSLTIYYTLSPTCGKLLWLRHYALGHNSEPLCQIPVALNRAGVVQLGGLNPVAAAVEAGVEIENIAESGLIDFEQLHSFREL